MDFLQALIELTYAMAPFILLGLLIAGILHEIVPDSFIKKHLGKDDTASVIKATLFGIPIPVCSCGVIPLATSLQKQGASKGAVLSFLISTPITGIDSILATYGMFGWLFTIYRILTSTIIAIIAGLLVNRLDTPRPQTPLFGQVSTNASPAKVTFGTKPITTSFAQSCSDDGCSCGSDAPKQRFSFINALRYGFITLLGDIAKPLFWGLVIGALISVAIPEDLSAYLADKAWLSYLLAVAIAVPMYVCATASLPIAAALMLHGVSAGAAFVFLTAGPATNTVTIGVVKKMLGTKAVGIYLATIAIGSIIFGIVLDWIFAGVDVKAIVHIDEHAGILTMASAALLWILILYHLVREKLAKKSCCG